MDLSSSDTRPPTPDAHSPSKVHMWILILLSWTAVFSLLSVGLLLTKSSDPALSTTELSAACQNGVFNGITTNLTRISEACSEENLAEADEYISVVGTAWYPGFNVPEGWHISGVMNDPMMYTITMSDQPMITYHFNTDELSVAHLWITTKGVPADGIPDRAAYIASLYAGSEFTNVVTNSTSVSDGTLFTTSLDETPEIGTTIHKTILHYFGSMTLVTITYDNETDASDWETFSSSLDWSTIK